MYLLLRGRSAEAAGTATVGSVSAVLLIRKKGLFAGVSLEGSAIVERREANRKFYEAIVRQEIFLLVKWIFLLLVKH